MNNLNMANYLNSYHDECNEFVADMKKESPQWEHPAGQNFIIECTTLDVHYDNQQRYLQIEVDDCDAPPELSVIAYARCINRYVERIKVWSEGMGVQELYEKRPDGWYCTEVFQGKKRGWSKC